MNMDATISILIKDHVYTAIINDFYDIKMRNIDGNSDYFQCGIFDEHTIPTDHIILDYIHAIKGTHFYSEWMEKWTTVAFQVMSRDHNC